MWLLSSIRLSFFEIEFIRICLPWGINASFEIDSNNVAESQQDIAIINDLNYLSVQMDLE